MKRGASRVPLYLAAPAVLLLLGVVAVASSGSTPTGSADTRPPGNMVADTIFSLFLVLLIPGLAIVVYGLVQRKEIAEEMAKHRHGTRPFLVFVAFVTIYTAILAYGMNRYRPRGGPDPGESGFPGVGEDETQPTGSTPGLTRDPEFAWIPVLVILALVAIAVGAYVLYRRSTRYRFAHDSVAAGRVADALGTGLDSFDDLWAEPDPRKAVIAAYARLERALGASGLPRHPQETAQEYVARVLARLEVDARPVRALTERYTEAKFSLHSVTETARSEAIEALERIRDDLRALARRQEEERAELASRKQAAAT